MKVAVIITMLFVVAVSGCAKSEEQEHNDATEKSIAVPPAKTGENKAY